MMTESTFKKQVQIEVCIDSVESAIAAVQGGADRLELCGNLGLGGGTTPSLGLFHAIRSRFPSVAIMVMIRPRTGDFLYTESEMEVMIADIRIFKEAGANGVVLGVLTKEGFVDVLRTQELVNEAHPMEVTFHRAFDMGAEPSDSMRGNVAAIASIHGITRILTSGRGITAPSSLKALESIFREVDELNKQRDKPLIILPGSGINPKTVNLVLEALLPLGLQEVHLSAGSWIPSEMRYRPIGMNMGVGGEGEWGIWRTDGSKVASVKGIINDYIRRVV